MKPPRAPRVAEKNKQGLNDISEIINKNTLRPLRLCERKINTLRYVARGNHD